MWKTEIYPAKREGSSKVYGYYIYLNLWLLSQECHEHYLTCQIVKHSSYCLANIILFNFCPSGRNVNQQDLVMFLAISRQEKHGYLLFV